MERRFQFSSRTSLLVTILVALWSINVAFLCPLTGGLDGYWLEAGSAICLFLVGALPPAALGALFRQTWFGLLCGLVSTIALEAWDYFRLLF